MEMDDNKRRRNMILYVLIAFVVYLVLSTVLFPNIGHTQQITKTDYSTFVKALDKKSVDKVEYNTDDYTIYYTKKGEDENIAYKTTGVPNDAGFTDRVLESGASLESVVPDKNSGLMTYYLLTLILPMAIFFLIGWWLNRRMKKAMGDDGPSMNFGGGGFGGGGFDDLNDIFGSFFGGGFGGFGGGGQSRTGPAKGSTVRASLTLTLEEAAFGCEKDVNISHVESCDVCGGTGCEPGTTAEVCPECHGSGQVRMQQRTMFGTMSTSTVCPNCRGEGKIIHQKCKACGGSGGVRRQKKVHVKVPAGIDNGQAISVRGQGDMGRNGGPAGDLIVGINVMPHARLRRDGAHIYLDQTVSILQATLGGEVEIPSLDGKIKCKVEPGTQPGTTLRLRGRGVPALNGRGRGDQYVTIRVEIPRNLNEDQKEALRKFAEAMGELPASSSAGESGERSVFHRRKKK